MSDGLKSLFKKSDKQKKIEGTLGFTMPDTESAIMISEEELEESKLKQQLIEDTDYIEMDAAGVEAPDLFGIERKEASHYKQCPSKSSDSKSKRKKIAAKQKEDDTERCITLKKSVDTTKAKTGKEFIDSTLTFAETKALDGYAERDDVTGHKRHEHEKNGKARSKDVVIKDVENLFVNLRRDMVLEDKHEYPIEFKEMMDAYSITFLLAEDRITELKTKRDDPASTPEEHKEFAIRAGQLSEYSLWVRNTASQHMITLTALQRDITAYEMAKEQIQYESFDTDYQKQELEYLDEKIAEKREAYERQRKLVLQKMEEPKKPMDQAYCTMTKYLASVKQRLEDPDISEDAKNTLMEEAKRTLRDFRFNS